MAEHKVQKMLESDQVWQYPVRLINGPDGFLLCAGPEVPGAVAGYAPGCLWIHTDGTTNATVLYCNIGNGTTADFNVVTVAA